MNAKRLLCLLFASLALGLSTVGCNGDGGSDADTQAAMNSRNAQRGGASQGAPPSSGTAGAPAATAGGQ